MSWRSWLRKKLLLGPIREWPTLSYQDVGFSSRDGVLLRGWWLPAPEGRKCLIIVHGGTKHRADPTIGMIQLAEGLVERDYNVLMFDFRGHGDSAGEWRTVGPEEAQDVLGAFDWVCAQGINPENIAILGFSMGAAAAIWAAVQDPRISAIISDSCWADFSEMMELRWEGSLRSFSNLLLQMLVGKMEALNPVGVVGSASARIFFIHGREDMTIPWEHAKRLYGVSRNPTNRLWVVDGASHVGAYRIHPKEYIDQVVQFLEAG